MHPDQALQLLQVQRQNLQLWSKNKQISPRVGETSRQKNAIGLTFAAPAPLATPGAGRAIGSQVRRSPLSIKKVCLRNMSGGAEQSKEESFSPI